MFEAAEVGRKIAKKAYKAREPDLRQALLEAQARLREADFPVILLFAGVDGAGKSETANQLLEWVDPRWVRTVAFGPPSDEESERPLYWRYWRELPQAGQIGIYLGSWYHAPLLDRVHDRIDGEEMEERLERASSFERTLADDGALILKFWMHLGRDQQAKRLKQLESDELTAWRVQPRDWEHWHMYDRFVGAGERLISRTDTGKSPWTIVEGTDPRFRSLRVGEVILGALTHHLEERLVEREVRTAAAARRNTEPAPAAAPDLPAEPVQTSAIPTVLSNLDLGVQLAKAGYERKLPRLQARLHLLEREARSEGISTILVFEGWDAAGKGGSIRRITHALDARDYTVIPVAAPTDEERSRQYLWRFWRRLPRAGRVTIFDRSWYGRVLVERVEGFATRAEWSRAYAEINDFEEQLVDDGSVVVKFWMHISPEEQERRFREREGTPWKSWKLTQEDWRNRARWEDYERAVHELVARTSTPDAPWTLVEAQDKRHARIKCLKTVCDALQVRLKRNDGK